ncbi:MAG: biotin/lipoyl-binding protein [Caldilineaceae bacterium]
MATFTPNKSPLPRADNHDAGRNHTDRRGHDRYRQRLCAAHRCFEIGDDQTVELVAVAGGAAEVTAPGVIMAAATEAVDVPATAKIAAVAARKGDTVAEGDALFALDTTDLEAAVTDALAAVQAAGDGDNAVDAQAALETAAQNLAAAQVTASIAGTVIAVNVAIGDSVDAGSPAVVIATDSALDVA